MRSAMPWRGDDTHWRRMELEFLLQSRPRMSQHLVSLQTLYTRFDLIARRGAPGDSQAAHDASAGLGRLRLWGVPPSSEDREVVPDWVPRAE
jgi:hypothetical protein